MSVPRFAFITAPAIQVGAGKLAEVPGQLQKFGVAKPLLVNDGRPGGDAALASLRPDPPRRGT
jgi:hypothetical protein